MSRCRAVVDLDVLARGVFVVKVHVFAVANEHMRIRFVHRIPRVMIVVCAVDLAVAEHVGSVPISALVQHHAVTRLPETRERTGFAVGELYADGGIVFGLRTYQFVDGSEAAEIGFVRDFELYDRFFANAVKKPLP